MSVLYEVIENVALITINRPDKHNAMNPAVAQALKDAWVRFDESTESVAILTSAGNNAFCVGADLTDLPGDVWQTLPNFAVPCEKPIIAAVSGHVIGVGASIALYADIVIASESTKFMYPEAKIGIFQGIMGGFPKKMPYGVGLEWAMTGDPMSAHRAYEIGFVNKVCPVGEQVNVAMEIAQKIQKNAPLVIRTMKNIALRTLPRSPIDDYYPQKARLQSIEDSLDSIEGLTAFKEKRRPIFSGN